MSDLDSADDLRLADRVAAADRGEAPAPAPDQPQPGAPTPTLDRTEHYKNAAMFFGRMVRAVLPPRVKPYWHDGALQELGIAFARCAAHYGWDFDPLHPLAQLGGAAMPLLWPIAEPVVSPYLKLLQPKPAANEPAAHAMRRAEPGSTRQDDTAQPSAPATMAEAPLHVVAPPAPGEPEPTKFPPRDQRAAPIETEPVS
jgi:hypothetical protein